MVKVLMSLGDWKIRVDDVYENQLKHFASHNCDRNDGSRFGELAWFYTDVSHVCYHCGETVPDEVQVWMALLV